MKIEGKTAEKLSSEAIERIKKLAIVSMFSDDDLLDQLVLKGGNAMDLVHRIGARASVDVDFSMKEDFKQEDAQKRVEQALQRTFEIEAGYLAFDIKMENRPGKMSPELADFWGGYQVEFKLIPLARANEVGRDPEVMRREAIQLGQSSRFLIDISRYEYTEDKQEAELEGYKIYVYSPEMIVCEKLRAICQQMPDYMQIIKTNKARQRARDFVDIEAIVRTFKVDLGTDRAREMVKGMFAIKRVPLSYLPRIPELKDFHGAGYDEVRGTIKAGVELKPWDYYFDFVVEQVQKLKPLWDK